MQHTKGFFSAPGDANAAMMLLDGQAEHCAKKKMYGKPEPTLGLVGKVDMWVSEDQKQTFSFSATKGTEIPPSCSYPKSH